MDLHVAVSEPSLAEIYDAQECALTCIAADEDAQAIEWFTKALSLIAPLASWSSGATSPTELCDSMLTLSIELLLERADCHLRLWQFDQALADADNVLVIARKNIKAKRVKCEALFGLQQERTAMKLWTSVLLEKTVSAEMELLRRRHPVAAVHVFHAVKTAEPQDVPKADEPAPTIQHEDAVETAAEPTVVEADPFGRVPEATTVEAIGATPEPGETKDTERARSQHTTTTTVLVEQTHPSTSEVIATTTVVVEHTLSTLSEPITSTVIVEQTHPSTSEQQIPTTMVVEQTHPPSNTDEITISTKDDMDALAVEFENADESTISTEDDMDALAVEFDPYLHDSDWSDGSVAEIASSCALLPEHESLESAIWINSNVPDCNESIVLVGAGPSPAVPTAAIASDPVDTRATLQRVIKAVLHKEGSTIDIADAAIRTTFEWLDPSALFDRALCVQALSSASVADKIAALKEYVVQNPLNAEWVPHALYMMSAHYLDTHACDDAARMRFLADEVEQLRPSPIDVATFPTKGDVENAFTLPWLVMSFDHQRRSVLTGSFACRSCQVPIALTEYVDHRMTRCPGLHTK